MKISIAVIAMMALLAACAEPDPVIIFDQCWANGLQVRPAPPDSLILPIGGTALVAGKEFVPPGCPDPGVLAVSFHTADSTVVQVTPVTDTSAVVLGKRAGIKLVTIVGRNQSQARGVVIVVVR